MIIINNEIKNYKPLKIDIKKELDEEDDFEDDYTVIVREKIFQRYNSNQCFESIYNIGNLLVIELGKQNICNLNQIISNTSKILTNKKIINHIHTWVKINNYPFDSKQKLGYEIDFIINSIELYILFEVHKWLIKMYNQKSKEINKEEIDAILELLKYIDLDSFIQMRLGKHKYIYALEKQKEEHQNERYYLHKCLEDSSFINTTKNKIYFMSHITQYIIEYLKEQLNCRKYVITKETIYYSKKTNQYRILDTTNSIMSIAYNKLLLHLTSTTLGYRKGICQIPGCNNEFTKTNNRQKYCKSDTCKSYKNSKYCKNYREKHKKGDN